MRAHDKEPTLNLASLWSLDPSVTYLNHGSFGACPTAVLAAQGALRLELEREPVDFLVAKLPGRLNAARQTLAEFLGAAPEDLVFVANATAAVNAVLRSLALEPGDELLLTNHTYAACRKAADFVAERTGARVVVANLPFPCRSDEEFLAAMLSCTSPRTRLALVDHVTSPTALVLPIVRLVGELQARGVDALVDGAHAPGMVPLNYRNWTRLTAPVTPISGFVRRRARCLPSCAPRPPGAAAPNVISHGFTSGFRAEFDWTGTFDPTPWLCIPSTALHGQACSRGWAASHGGQSGSRAARPRFVAQSTGVESPCPEAMIGSMASIPLPPAQTGSRLRTGLQGPARWFREQESRHGSTRISAAAACLGATLQ